MGSWNRNKFDELIKKLLAAPTSFGERTKSVSDNLMPILRKAVRTDASVRDAAAKQHGEIMGVAVYGFADGQLVLHHTSFSLLNGNNVGSETKQCPGDCPVDHTASIKVPATERIHFTEFPLIAARSFVQTQIDRNTVDIAGPLQLLTIDRNGKVEWIERGSCELP